MTERYPERSVRIVVPFPPGGSTDFAATAIAPHLQASFGQVVVVDSVVGDRGVAALRALASADPLGECGFAGIGTNHWQGLFAPGTTPAPVVQRLHEAVRDVLGRDEPRRALERAGGRVTPSASPERFAAELDAELGRWEAVREAISAHPDPSRSLAG
jgi:tripartite-type tricarboxylate transporter receptor subunit TctC